MRSVVIHCFVAAVFSGAASAYAQDPPETPPPPPPPAAQARERAVPRPERAPDPSPRVESPRESSPRREPVTREAPPPVRENSARENRTGEEGSRRRLPVETAATPAPVPTPAPTSNAARSEDQGAERRGAVRRPPSDGRGGVAGPRDRAVARTSPPPDRDRDRSPVYVYPDYWSYGRYYDPYSYSGFHLGYLAYSPWGWMPAFYGNPYGYYGSGYYQARGWDVGAVRLKVKQRDAEVYVDGYFAGTVDDFDGVFQSLKLDSGAYRIEIRKPGYETLYFDVRVQPDRTITYRGDMRAAP